MKFVKLQIAGPGDLRRYWQFKHDSTLNIKELRPPSTIGPNLSLFVTNGAWTAFWNADIPHQARTAWWRLLHDKIPHRLRLHRRQPDVHKSPKCYFCKREDEDDFHLFVGCQSKWPIWSQALQELAPSARLDSPTMVWQILLLMEYKDIRKTSGTSILSSFGLILVSIWQFHWKCSIEQKRWVPEACLWAIRRNRWRWSMQLPLVEEPEVEGNALVAIKTSWCEEVEELRVTAYARSDDIGDFRKYGVYLDRFYIPHTPMPVSVQRIPFHHG